MPTRRRCARWCWHWLAACGQTGEQAEVGRAQRDAEPVHTADRDRPLRRDAPGESANCRRARSGDLTPPPPRWRATARDRLGVQSRALEPVRARAVHRCGLRARLSAGVDRRGRRQRAERRGARRAQPRGGRRSAALLERGVRRRALARAGRSKRAATCARWSSASSRFAGRSASAARGRGAWLSRPPQSRASRSTAPRKRGAGRQRNRHTAARFTSASSSARVTGMS